jgi:hypothetical protein
MTAYSRERTVKAIRSYYAFLAAKLGAIRPQCIIEPPVGGWRNITTTSLAHLEKTDEVIELLRHLPYIKGDSKGQWNSKIAFETYALRYGGADAMPSNGTASDMWPPGAGEIPAHVAVLTMGARYGSWLLLDTVEGQPTLLLLFTIPYLGSHKSQTKAPSQILSSKNVQSAASLRETARITGAHIRLFPLKTSSSNGKRISALWSGWRIHTMWMMA